jgi:hypothetical protein
MLDDAYNGFGSYVVTIIFDKAHARESFAIVSRVRLGCNALDDVSLGLPAIRYLGVDAPDGIDKIGFLIGGEFYSGDRTDDIVAKIGELEKAAQRGEW